MTSVNTTNSGAAAEREAVLGMLFAFQRRMVEWESKNTNIMRKSNETQQAQWQHFLLLFSGFCDNDQPPSRGHSFSGNTYNPDTATVQSIRITRRGNAYVALEEDFSGSRGVNLHHLRKSEAGWKIVDDRTLHRFDGVGFLKNPL